MNQKIRIYSLIILLIVLTSCSNNSSNPIDNNSTVKDTIVNIGNGQSCLVSTDGILKWDGLPQTEKNRILNWSLLFLHQSVGGDLEEGCRANGVNFEYYGKDVTPMNKPFGGIFIDVGNIANGNPYEKIRVFKDHILKHKNIWKICVFKFGYADIDDDNYLNVEIAYKNMIDEIRILIPNMKFVHVTPPLVYSIYEGNSAKRKVGEWMIETFKNKDVVFDFESIESKNGECSENSIWRICPEFRASKTDPSEINGVDETDGTGHLGKKAAGTISKAFLYSIYLSGK
ncbi:MAG: hypothetical protein IPP08_09435 [Chlorobiota bacterium]|nr:MAG: hypothetical protein IPP08_09435 [Chlorobiota bacterium]